MKEATAAPLLSQLEWHHLTSMAVHYKRVLKNYDDKPAFIQFKLPDDEVYFWSFPLVVLDQNLDNTVVYLDFFMD